MTAICCRLFFYAKRLKKTGNYVKGFDSLPKKQVIG